ncbi:polysaccharide lyase family 7 protein [Leucothrix arctica]|uniref:F5/8 type C domain-containing protein n=1 Tax=Leucothrix arctica TaxID=1481894 RepID=A0A317C6H7_9GAMM|nr:polysaccharide lyase family 7 protein [Leucothrix arctica]PWQ94245.1 hypothetical protein DKT75_17065 [Leucothrix arctica]
MNHFSATAISALLLCAGSVSANTACDGSGPLTIISATDDGMFDDVSHSPASLLDGSTDPDSRWSNESQGSPKEILFDLGAQQTLKSFSAAWYKGDSRKSNFKIEASLDGKTFQTIVADRTSSGTTLELETYEFDAVKAQYIKFIGNGNESNNWNSMTEVVATGCGVAVEKPKEIAVAERKGAGMFGLHLDKPPGENFDLQSWYLSVPTDEDGDGKSDNVFENELAAGWTHPKYFYTDPATGGMVFHVSAAGAKTSKNTSYTRSELRGMLRRGDYNIETRIEGGYPNKNNWVFSSAPKSAQAASAGVDGKMTATMSVNQVTRLGKAYQVGRVVIGQIHAKNDEPIRLYYRKLPTNKFGSIYFAHDPEVGKETWVDVIGKRANKIANPADGIALDEVFSYEIEVKGKQEGDVIIPMLHLKIIRDDGTEVVADPFDMRDSGFNVEDEFMFFKAGAYSGNNSSPTPETDFDKVTFFKLEATHSPAPEATADMKAVAEKSAKAAAVPAKAAVAGVIVDDSFADGGRDNGADALDTAWWATTTSGAIEVAKGHVGLVSGGSGRGIRATFDPQTLAEGQTIKADFTFTTPETMGTNRDSALRVGIYDKLGRADLEGDLSASSKKPNLNYNGLPGYMIDFDVNLKDPTKANINIRKHKDATTGRLLGTTKGYTELGAGGNGYQFVPGETYTGSIAVQKLAAGIKVTGSLSQDGTVLSEFSKTDEKGDANNFGMLAFHVNSKTFGSSKKKDTPDNGIDIKNLKVEILP